MTLWLIISQGGMINSAEGVSGCQMGPGHFWTILLVQILSLNLEQRHTGIHKLWMKPWDLIHKQQSES